jgi:hypothetical protein
VFDFFFYEMYGMSHSIIPTTPQNSYDAMLANRKTTIFLYSKPNIRDV